MGVVFANNQDNTSKQNMEVFQRNLDKFLHCLVIADKIWTHHYQPESKEQSRQWVEASESAPNKVKRVPPAGNVWPMFFGIPNLN